MTDRLEYPPPAITALKRWAPPPPLAGFLALLILMFAVAYGVGTTAGPVAPGMRSTGGDTPRFDTNPRGPHGHGGGTVGTGGAR
ncbi:hypothetical protein ACGFZK_08785 [Streptomyces sp. NPDC048257]|uniref:hypothetical protein n=1 Tax=Streptomyces sp. NPDC048257 TaxID=3365526 RepID=UPI00371BA63F